MTATALSTGHSNVAKRCTRSVTGHRTARQQLVVCSATPQSTQKSRPILSGALLLAASLPIAAPAFADQLDDIVQAVSANPLYAAAGAGAIAIVGGIAAVVGGSSGAKAKGTTPDKTLEALEQEPRVILVDIRTTDAVKESGMPDLRSVKKKVASVPFTKIVDGEPVVIEDFVERLQKNPAIKEDSIIILLDSFGLESPKAAKLIGEALEKDTMYFVVDGAEGPKGWKATGPWKEPAPALSFSLPSISVPEVGKLGASINTFAESYKSSPSLLKGVLAVGGIAAAALLLLTEVEVVLELVGVVAAGQFLTKNLLFAKDREKTLKQIRTLIQDKIAAGDASEDLKKLATTILEVKLEPEATQTATQNGAAPPPPPTTTTTAVDDDIAARKADAQRWIAAWRARTSSTSATKETVMTS